MASTALKATIRTIGLVEFSACIFSISDAIEKCSPAPPSEPLAIVGEGLSVTFQGAPLVSADVRTTNVGGEIVFNLVIRPAGGLGMLVAFANLVCGGRLDTVWSDGWPMVSVSQGMGDLMPDDSATSQRENAGEIPPGRKALP